MAEVTILLDIKSGFKKEEVCEDLFWYDTIKKEMVEFKGGRLIYEYREDPYLVSMGEQERVKRGINSTWRLLPKVSSVIITNYNKPSIETNEKKIIKICEDYSTYNEEIEIESISDENILVSVSDESVDEFCYQLERNGIRYYEKEKKQKH